MVGESLDKPCKASSSAHGETKDVKKYTIPYNMKGKNITMIDTPGIFDNMCRG